MDAKYADNLYCAYCAVNDLAIREEGLKYVPDGNPFLWMLLVCEIGELNKALEEIGQKEYEERKTS